MRSTRAPTANHLIAVGDKIFDRTVDVREGSPQPLVELPVAVTAASLSSRAVTSVIGGDKIFSDSVVPSIHHLLRETAHQIFVLLRHRISPSALRWPHSQQGGSGTNRAIAPFLQRPPLPPQR